MPDLRIAIVGLGVQGREHLRLLRAGRIPRACASAIVSPRPPAADDADAAGLPWFPNLAAGLAGDAADAVVIAAPHAAHRPLAEEALRAGRHVLLEKPVAISATDAHAMVALHHGLGAGASTFAAVHNQRTDPRFARVRGILASGALGRLHRVAWSATHWYRTDAYYRSAPWRGTWTGEGGGVLVNQAVHQLDLWAWLFGMPRRLRAWVRRGAWHGIEVEDDVTCVMTMACGACGTFTASTGDSPGAERLEIDAEGGRLVVEGDLLRWIRPCTDLAEHRRTSADPWHQPAHEVIEERFADRGPQLAGVLADFAAAALDRRAPLAPVAEAAQQVTLANAMLISGIAEQEVDLPLEHGRFDRVLARLRGREAEPYRGTIRLPSACKALVVAGS